MIRWTFTDRKTGLKASVPHPTTDEERQVLTQILHNLL